MLKTQINNAGGINGHAIDFIIVDDKSDATQTYTLAKQLVDENNPLAIIGATTSGGSVALINMSMDSGIPIISLAGSSKIVTPVTPWVFKMPPSEYQVSDMLLPYIASQNITKIAIIVSSSGWGSSGKAALPIEAPKYNLTVVGDVQVYASDATSTIPQLQTIKGSDAQAIVCWDTDQGSAMVARDMQTLNMTIPLFVSHGAANKGFITSSEGAANGAVLAVGKVLIADQLPTTDPQRAVLVKYKNDYEALYGNGSVNPFGGHAYDAVNILLPVLKSMSESTAANLSDARIYIRNGVENTSNYIGIGGVYTMSPTDHLGLSQQLSNFLCLIKVVNGQWTWIKQ
jgi:branched-chain amino acid transport system substrate-binding protein